MTDGVQLIDRVYAALRLVCDAFNCAGYLMDAAIDFFADRRLLLRGAGDVRVTANPRPASPARAASIAALGPRSSTYQRAMS